MYFRLEGQFDAYGVKDQRSLTNGIRDTLAMVGKISKLRVSSVLVSFLCLLLYLSYTII